MSRAQAYILRNTEHGRRMFPITTAEAEELVQKTQAKLLKPGFYDGTKTVNGQKTRNLTTTGTPAKSRSKRS